MATEKVTMLFLASVPAYTNTHRAGLTLILCLISAFIAILLQKYFSRERPEHPCLIVSSSYTSLCLWSGYLKLFVLKCLSEKSYFTDFMCFLKSWIIKHLCCPPLKTDSLASTLSKSEFGWFESAQDLWALAVSSQMSIMRNPSSWWWATKHDVLPRKEICHYSGRFAPGGLRFHCRSGAAETEAPHCTHTHIHSHRGNWPLKCDMHCEVGPWSFSFTHPYNETQIYV